jgi:hypothetical protein
MHDDDLSPSTIQRLISYVPKLEPNHDYVLKILKSKETDERSKALRRAAITWCGICKLDQEIGRYRVDSGSSN